MCFSPLDVLCRHLGSEVQCLSELTVLCLRSIYLPWSCSQLASITSSWLDMVLTLIYEKKLHRKIILLRQAAFYRNLVQFCQQHINTLYKICLVVVCSQIYLFAIIGSLQIWWTRWLLSNSLEKPKKIGSMNEHSELISFFIVQF